jgi:hypothetical protein
MSTADANNKGETLADDKLRGAKAIADFIDEDLRRTYDLLEKGILPAGKLGRTWIGSKRRLRKRYDEVTSGEAA